MKVEYPKYLYHAQKPAALVKDVAEHVALGPGWYESPTEVGGPQPAVPATSTANETPAVTLPEPQTTTSAPAPDPPAEPKTIQTDIAASEKAALWAAKVDDVVKMLAASSKESLERVKAYESENPKGPRKGILDAIDKLAAQQK